jgi:DNA-binding transcriptional regulator YdaS (Cro superfamily)
MDMKEIIKAGNGPSKLASGLGLSHATVLCWKQVPPHHVPAVSALTGIPRHELRPDLWEAPAGAPTPASAA